MTRVVTDPQDPRFPHNATGYHRGCHCARCRRGHMNAKHRRDLAKAAGRALPYALVDAGPARAHLRELLELPHVSVFTVRNLTGLARCALHLLLDGQPAVRHRTAAAVLALTPQQVAASSVYVDGARTALTLRRLQAAGWPLAQLHRDHHLPARPYSIHLDPGTPVTRRFADAVERMAAAIGDRAPDLAAGEVHPRKATYVAHIAAAAGYYPAAAYDEDGTLDLTAVPGTPEHAAAQQQEKAWDRLSAVLETHDGRSSAAVCQRYGMHGKQLGDLRRATGMVPVMGPSGRPMQGRWRLPTRTAADLLRTALEPGSEADPQEVWCRVAVHARRTGRAA